MPIALAPHRSAGSPTGPLDAVSAKGMAKLDVRLVAGQSAVTGSQATSPMKLLAPRARGQSVWAYTSSFGGGLVAGDQTRLDLTIGPGARCFMGTQTSTKIYRNPARLASGHITRAMVEENAVLVFAPDPVQAFADSTYVQRQEFRLASGTGLALVDWFTSGRAARGERWAFHKFQSRNDVFVSGERAFVDAVLLSPDKMEAVTCRRINCVALLLLLGAPMTECAEKVLTDIAARPVERQAALVTSASPVRDGTILRVAGESVEQVGRELHHHLKSLIPLLGDDPWARKW